jgi:hypothetical protein
MRDAVVCHGIIRMGIFSLYLCLFAFVFVIQQ